MPVNLRVDPMSIGRWPRPWVACVLCLVGVVSPCEAQQQEMRPIRVRLLWENRTQDPTCIDAKTLVKDVEDRLQRSVFIENNPDLVLEGAVVLEAGKPVVRISLHDANGSPIGRRELESEDRTCSTLNAAVPLSVALMIDYQQSTLRLHVPVVAVAPAPLAAVARPRPKPAVVQETEPWQLGFGLGAAAQVGVLPEITWLTTVGMEAIHGRGAFRVEASWLPPRSVSYDVGRVTITGWTVDGSGCGAWLRASGFRSSLCAGFQAGRILEAGAGFDHNNDSAAGVGGLWAGVDAQIPGERSWGMRLGLSGGVPLVRHQIEFTNESGDSQTLYQSSGVYGRLALTFVHIP